MCAPYPTTSLSAPSTYRLEYLHSSVGGLPLPTTHQLEALARLRPSSLNACPDGVIPTWSRMQTTVRAYYAVDNELFDLNRPSAFVILIMPLHQPFPPPSPSYCVLTPIPTSYSLPLNSLFPPTPSSSPYLDLRQRIFRMLVESQPSHRTVFGHVLANRDE